MKTCIAANGNLKDTPLSSLGSLSHDLGFRWARSNGANNSLATQQTLTKILLSVRLTRTEAAT
jgi:hypothetical protein